ncbi:MAG: hypothetical protein ACJAT2_001742 [Bacteriovoracaceae bacterium]|jgi:hypothetical protein
MTDDYVAIKASVTMKENALAMGNTPVDLEKLAPSFPIQALRLLSAYEFKMKIVGLDENQNEIYKKTFDSDSYGNFNFKIPLTEESKGLVILQLYEVGKEPGLQIHLGTAIPLRIPEPKKIIICDFDKTLVDTRYSTTRDVYNSLTKPLESFPTLVKSVEILQEYIKDGFHPFILSASPHFYEDAMRDWLYQNHIYTAGIFLKDYRKIFSFFEGDLTTKDLKVQGLYKLNHLLDILLMAGIPKDIVLMGDNFESDPIIYLTMAMILKQDHEPWKLWKIVKSQDSFQLNRKQNGQFLNKIFQLNNMIGRLPYEVNLKIYIRKKANEETIKVPAKFKGRLPLIELYDGKPLLAQKDSGSKKDNIADA